MSEPFAGLRRFLRELKRRNVYRVTVDLCWENDVSRQRAIAV